ncbi:radical SAM family heme chaperone HemW [Clostridium brassicae]|uniref:Heme chaperone HemW n=1 Tax=Clostridium brassicae TaxID=2999072 RepID=A0ABT4DBN3_9CLOT|nr:radical SAM family heme chaperone HemW [Clostridium brassicae]MCY6959710.1 radical SAM family heme chaperone HemW [Clostridium brassicae]
MNDGIALYIHIPFCKQKCLYCDFPSYCGEENKMLSYSKALSKEINRIKDKKISTIFIGGGTPTYLSLEGWNTIKESIKRLNTTDDLEFTVEGNPGTFSEDKLLLFKNIGVNRLSIGLQAWQNEHLKRLGRIHSVEEFLESFYMARKVGFENINIDLMFGLPEQSLEEWKQTLENVTNLEPEHLSCYSLIVEEGTRFYDLYDKDKLNLPDEDIEREMYRFTLQYLKENQYHQYEISNFSKHNRECKHNLVYWNLEEYLGCGSAAHSYIDGYRFRNVQNIDKYISNEVNGISPVEEKNKNSEKDDMEEFMFMGLRKIDGISTKKFNKKFRTSIYDIYGDVIKKYVSQNLLVEKEGQMFLTPRGVEISNTVMSDFIL